MFVGGPLHIAICQVCSVCNQGMALKHMIIVDISVRMLCYERHNRCIRMKEALMKHHCGYPVMNSRCGLELKGFPLMFASIM